MQPHAWKCMLGLLALLYAGRAAPQQPALTRFDAALVDFRQQCSLQWISAARCSCVSGKVKAIDPALAETLTDDKAIHSFLDDADRECVIAEYRDSVRTACLLDAENSRARWARQGFALDAQESCNCVYERVKQIGGQELRDDDAIARRNKDAQLKDPKTKPYWSKIDQLRLECEEGHVREGSDQIFKRPKPRPRD